MEKIVYTISWGLIILTLSSLNCKQLKAENENISFKALHAAFKNPEKQFRSAPLWVWNDKMNRTSIDTMLHDLKDKGFGGAFVHPRPGLITEYLSDEWFEMFKYSVDKGKELGLNIWIYDENSYPSGFAGGHVPAQMPESYNQGQGLKMMTYELLPDTLSNVYLCLLEVDDNYKDITSEINKYKNKTAHFRVFTKTFYKKSPWYGGFTYVDLLVPGVTQKFQEITMSGYEKIAGDEFGKTIPGIFTDEPEIPTPGGIRWTPDLFDIFQKKWGYDLKVNLPSLYEEVGNWKMIRHNYIETLLQLFIDRWSKPWFEYCEKNNLKWTGHYWEHGWPDLAQGGDNMAMYAWHQQPAIDMLFNQFEENNPRAQFGNIRAVKELRSVANQLGYKRTLCETYGGGGWDVTFKDLKRLGDWTYVLGVNFMNQHLAHSTLKGARKYDYPPVFTYHSPWWPHYKVLNDYFGRLSVALSMGEQNNDILIIEPTTTLWNYYSYVKNNETLEQIGKEFQSFITNLEKSQVEYDLGSENIIKDRGSVTNGKLVIGKRNYSIVVIPANVENIEKRTFELLLEFAHQGGKILSFSKPERLSGQISQRVVDFFNPTNTSVTFLNQVNDETIEKHFSTSEVQFKSIIGGNLFHHQRIYNDGKLLFLVNSSMEDVTKGSLNAKGLDALKMDPFTGEIENYPFQTSGKELTINFEIPAAGSLMLFISDTQEQQKINNNENLINEEVVESQSPIEIFALRDNALKIDFCDLFIEGEKHENVYFSKAADIVFGKYGFEGNPWNHSVQYKSQIVDRDTFKTGKFNVEYKFSVNGDISGNNMKICVERPEIFKVKMNGTTVKPLTNKWFLDKSFPVYDISSLVRSGENSVEISVEPMSIFAEIEPIYVLGNFTVLPVETGWIIDTKTPDLSLGPWGKQGLPFYSWEVAYKRIYNLNGSNKSYKVVLPEWQGTVSEVYVNTHFAGIIGFDPYELDVSKYLKVGKNEIEVRVVGSLKNLLGPHFKNPAPGLAGPGHWKNVEDNIPGVDYQLLDYGLFNEFDLITF